MNTKLKKLDERLRELYPYRKKFDRLSQSLQILRDDLIQLKHLSKNVKMKPRDSESTDDEKEQSLEMDSEDKGQPMDETIPVQAISLREAAKTVEEGTEPGTIPPTSKPPTDFDKWSWLSQEILPRAIYIESLLLSFIPLGLATYYSLISPPQLTFAIVVLLMTMYAYIAKIWQTPIIYFSTHILFIVTAAIISSSPASFNISWRLGASPYSFYITPIVLFTFTVASSIYSGRSLKEPLLPITAVVNGVLLGFFTSFHTSQYWIEFADLTPILTIFTLNFLFSFFLRLQRQKGNLLGDLSPIIFAVVFWGLQQTLSSATHLAILPLLHLSFLCQIILLGATSFIVKRSNFTLFAMISSTFLILSNEYSRFTPLIIFISLLIHTAVFAVSISNLKRDYFFPLLNFILALPSILYLRIFFTTYPYAIPFFLGILIFEPVLVYFYMHSRPSQENKDYGADVRE